MPGEVHKVGDATGHAGLVSQPTSTHRTSLPSLLLISLASAGEEGSMMGIQ